MQIDFGTIILLQDRPYRKLKESQCRYRFRNPETGPEILDFSFSDARSHSRRTREIGLGNMPMPRGAPCNRIPVALQRWAQARMAERAGREVTRFSQVSESSYRVPSYRSPGISGQVAEVSDETPRCRKRLRRAGTFSVLLTYGGTTSSVTCGCRKSDDHPAGSCPESRGQIQVRERVAELNAALMTPLTCISG